MDKVKALNKNKYIVGAKSVVWIIQNGHVSRFEDYTYTNKFPALLGWLHGHLCMATRHWRLYELDGYVGEYDSCSPRGEDIEHDSYVHESTYEILSITRKSLDKIINMVFDDFAKEFDMEKFPKTDEGPYVQLLRCQMASVAIQ